jgi:hypothetical protein
MAPETAAPLSTTHVEERTMPNAIEQIYDKLAEVFGGTNLNQVFCMMMPGTSLDARQYTYDTTREKPATVQEAESKLTDQLFDIAKVTGSSNGKRLSTQYIQALSVLVPNFNPVVPPLKKTLRDFLNTPVPAGALVDGQPFTGTIQQYYFRLYEGWIQAKEAWEKKVLDKKQELASDPATEKEKYLEWYEQVAEGELAKLDEAMARVLGVLAPSDMNAMLGALASGPGGEIAEAVNATKDIRLASPNGGFFYPVDLLPRDWFLELASDEDPVNLLQDPEFIAASISAKRQALLASISQIQGAISQMPTQGDLKTAADALVTEQKKYVAAQNELLNTYTENTATAVTIYLEKYGEAGASDKQKALDDEANKVAAAKGVKTANGAQKRGGGGFGVDDLGNLVKGQVRLDNAQSALLTSAQALAAAGLTLGAEEAAHFGDLPILLERLQAQLADLKAAKDELARSIATQRSRPRPEVGAPPDVLKKRAEEAVNNAGKASDLEAALKVVEDACGDEAGLKALKQAAQEAFDKPKDALIAAITPIADDISRLSALNKAVADAEAAADLDAAFKAVENACGLDPGLTEFKDAAKKAREASSATKDTLLTAIRSFQTKNGDVAITTDIAAKVAKAVADASAARDFRAALKVVKGACGEGPTGKLLNLKNAANDAPENQSKDALIAAITPLAEAIGAPAAARSAGSQRFMDLQFSFSASDMSRISSTDGSFSKTSWGVNLFFGSASGSSTTGKASSAQHAFDSSTEIKIGLKAAKVDIQRGWFNPGLFMLSGEMSRLSKRPVSYGRMPPKTTGKPGEDETQDWADDKIKHLNDALLPAFPVAFLVVKDVNITFQASESSFGAVKTLVDSRSAAGGGFLCFSASSSSASRSVRSGIQSRSHGRVIHIAMPGPQILGWFLETTPKDESAVFKWNPATDAKALTASVEADAAEISIIEFTRRVAALRDEGARASRNVAPTTRATTLAQDDRNGQAPQADGNGHAPQLHA